MKKEPEIQIDTVQLTVEDYQKIVAEKDAKITELETSISEKDKAITANSEALFEKDAKITELQSIIDTQDDEIEKSEKVVVADSEKQKIIDAGFIPVIIGGVLKGAVSTIINGIPLDQHSEESLAELDALETVFITVK